MIHRSQNGVYTPISMLSDNHLVNIIKFPFKKYQLINGNKKLEFILGKKLPELTIDTYNKIVVDYCHYILEGLRRKFTREKVIQFLASVNPIWESDVREEDTNIIKELNPVNPKKDEYLDYNDFEFLNT